MKYLIGIDIGTSGTKSVLFDTDGNVIDSAYAEYPLYHPENGWAEQSPEDWWNAVCETLRGISAKASEGEVCGIGLSGQMHGLVMLDKSGEVLRRSIIWCDGRTTAECREIEAAVGFDKLIEISANPALEGFTASKIVWVKKHEPHIYARCRHILLPKDYIRYKLTGEFATEVSDASGMQLLDVKGRCWSEELCEILGIDMSYLPKMHESPEITGYVTKDAEALTGIPSGVAVVGGAGDNAAAAIGTGVCKNGKAFTTVGTSGVVFAHTDKPLIDKKGRIHTFCCAVPGEWHVMGVTQAACLSFNWFRENLADGLSAKELDQKCSEIPIGADRLLYLPYLMGERTPVLNSSARGVFFGLSAHHTKEHMARAVMEGVTFSLCNCLDVLDETGINPSDMAICGGGAKSALWRGMIADAYGMPLTTVSSPEAPALGVAILAGVGVGIYDSVAQACDKMVKVKSVTEFDENNHAEYKKFYDVYCSLYPSLKESFGKLAKL